MSAASSCRLLGRWRIVEADLWDRAYLDLCGPATLTITAQGCEIAFGAVQASLDVGYARDSIDFRWRGADEGDEVAGKGSAELLDDGTLEIEYSYDNGDEAVLKRLARRFQGFVQSPPKPRPRSSRAGGVKKASD